MNLTSCRHVDSTDMGGSLVSRPRRARRGGDRGRQVQRRADHARRPAQLRRQLRHAGAQPRRRTCPTRRSRCRYSPVTVNLYAMCAMRHMHEYGTTSEQLAWVKVAASHHAQHNPNAMLQRRRHGRGGASNSPMISDPLHRLDCCVVSDGGGALIVARPEIAKSLKRPLVKIIGAGETHQAPDGRQGRSHLHRRRVDRARARSRKRASSRPTSSTRRSTTASPSPS